MNPDVESVVIRVAIGIATLSVVWIMVSLVVDVVRLVRGAVNTRTFMGVVARYLVAGATVVPVLQSGVTARAAACETFTDETEESPIWLTPVVSGTTAVAAVSARDLVRRRRDRENAAVEMLSVADLRREEFLDDERPDVPTCVPPHDFVVGVLGPVCVTSADGDRVRFARLRSEELLVWLTLHPSKRFRSMARADMWASPVKDSTFANITSDLRKGLQSVGGDGSWLGVTLTDEMPLSGVVSDVDILRRCVDHARRWPEDGGVEALRYGLSLVRGTPFSGASYIWSDSTGLTTDAVVLVVRAATMLSDMCAEAHDVDGVYWATGQGLLAVPGQEDLLALRLRLHAQRDDRAGLVAEWRSYLRMLAADPWSDGAPSPAMAQVWAELGGFGSESIRG
jgi:hypothetical protein